VLAAGLAENLTQVLFRQPFVIQHVRTGLLSCETWNFSYFVFFHHYIINLLSLMLLYFLLLLRVISWFESQKCMIKPYHFFKIQSNPGPVLKCKIRLDRNPVTGSCSTLTFRWRNFMKWPNSMIIIASAVERWTNLQNLVMKRPIWQCSCASPRWRLMLALLRSEIPSGMCAKLRTVAASNNRDHARNLSSRMLVIKFNRSHVNIGRATTSQSLFLLLARATYIMVLFFMHIPFVVNHTINATPLQRLQQHQQHLSINK